MEKVKFGVIGLKGIGQSHINAINQVEEAELTAIADINEALGKSISSRLGVKWYKDYVEMLEKAEIDAVTICTPHHLHHPMALSAVEYGKHILVEKPMAITVDEADEMIRKAEKRNIKLGVVYQFRFNPAFRELKRLIDDMNQIYRVLMEACVFRSQLYYDRDAWRGKWATEGGGALINQTIHYFDLLQWFVGKPIRLYGEIGTLLHNIEVEDIAEATIIFESGAHGIVQVSSIDAPSTVRFEVYGDKGKIIMDNDQIKRYVLEKSLKNHILEGEVWGNPSYKTEEITVDRKGLGHKAVIEDFAKAIIEDREPAVSGENGRVSLEIVNAIILSSFLKKPVRFPIDRVEYRRLFEKLSSKSKD